MLVVLHHSDFWIKDEHVIFFYFYELPKCLFPLPGKITKHLMWKYHWRYTNLDGIERVMSVWQWMLSKHCHCYLELFKLLVRYKMLDTACYQVFPQRTIHCLLFFFYIVFFPIPVGAFLTIHRCWYWLHGGGTRGRCWETQIRDNIVSSRGLSRTNENYRSVWLREFSRSMSVELYSR